jgi:hypothetical protein
MQCSSITRKHRISFYCIISVQPPDISPPKRAPAKDPPFRLDGKTKDHVLTKFPAVKSDSSPTRRCSVCLKKKEIVKLGGIVQSVAFLYILGNVIPGTTLSKCTETSPEGMYKFSASCVL